MAKYASSKNPVSAASLKRKALGAVVVRHYGRVDVKFTRVHGGWSRTDVTSDPEVVSSGDVARECNSSVGCKSSWARVY